MSPHGGAAAVSNSPVPLKAEVRATSANPGGRQVSVCRARRRFPAIQSDRRAAPEDRRPQPPTGLPSGPRALSYRRANGWRRASAELLAIRLPGWRPALVARQTLYVRRVLRLVCRILLVRARSGADGVSPLGGGTVLVSRLARNSGARILRIRGRRNTWARRLRQRGWS